MTATLGIDIDRNRRWLDCNSGDAHTLGAEELIPIPKPETRNPRCGGADSRVVSVCRLFRCGYDRGAQLRATEDGVAQKAAGKERLRHIQVRSYLKADRGARHREPRAPAVSVTDPEHLLSLLLSILYVCLYIGVAFPSDRVAPPGVFPARGRECK